MSDSQDEPARTYAKVIAMRANLSESPIVHLSFGTEYGALVERAAIASRRDLFEFKIEHDHKVKHRDVYDADGFCAPLDGLLSYLQSLMPAVTVDTIGFR